MYSAESHNGHYIHVGFPIRRSTGQRLLTAHRRFSQFYHVRHRLLVPRHPPNALTSLTTRTVASLPLFRELETLRQMAKPSLSIFVRLSHSQTLVHSSHMDLRCS